jgi:hypothetical protein
MELVTPSNEEKELHSNIERALENQDSVLGVTQNPVAPSLVRRSESSLNPRKSHESTGGEKRSDTGSAGKDSSGSAKRNQIKRLRWKAWILLLASEVILGLLVLTQVLTFQSSVLNAASVNAANELHFLDLQFKDTFARNLLGVQTMANMTQMVEIFSGNAGQNSDIYKDLQVVFDRQSSIRRLEFITLLDSNGNIVLSVNANRTGQYWDPAGVFSSLKSSGAPYVLATDVLTQGDLNLENPPEYFEGSLSYQAKEHMQRTGTDGLIQYVGAPVKFDSMTHGFLIIGHIISGDTQLFEDSIALFGSGFGLVLFKDHEGNMQVALEMYSTGGLHSFAGTGLSQSQKQTILNQALSKDGEATSTSKLYIGDTAYMVAFKRTPPMQIGKNVTSTQSLAVCIVGHPLEEVNNVFEEVINTSLGLTAVCFIVDTVGMLISGKKGLFSHLSDSSDPSEQCAFLLILWIVFRRTLS